MGININMPTKENTVTNDINETPIEEKEFNIQVERKELVEKYENSAEVDEIASKIAIYDP